MAQIDEQEVIAIIDSSASMRTSFNEKTRFERALDKVYQLTDDVFKENGILSVTFRLLFIPYLFFNAISVELLASSVFILAIKMKKTSRNM